MLDFLKKAGSRVAGAVGAGVTTYLTSHNEVAAAGTFLVFLVYGVVHSAAAPSS